MIYFILFCIVVLITIQFVQGEYSKEKINQLQIESERLLELHIRNKERVDILDKERNDREIKDTVARTPPVGTLSFMNAGVSNMQVSVESKLKELRAKEKEEEAKVARLKLLEERDPKIQAWCAKNGLYVYSVDKEHSGREKEHNLPWNWTYCVCRKENIAHQVNYYSNEMARIIGIE